MYSVSYRSCVYVGTSSAGVQNEKRTTHQQTGPKTKKQKHTQEKKEEEPNVSKAHVTCHGRLASSLLIH